MREKIFSKILRVAGIIVEKILEKTLRPGTFEFRGKIREISRYRDKHFYKFRGDFAAKISYFAVISRR